jgi:hypothetical protein
MEAKNNEGIFIYLRIVKALMSFENHQSHYNLRERRSHSQTKVISQKIKKKKTVLLKKQSEEIEKWKCNITNGMVGMNRDINIKLTKYFKTDGDVIEVYYFLLFILFFSFLFLFFFYYSLCVLVHSFLSGLNISYSRLFDVLVFYSFF